MFLAQTRPKNQWSAGSFHRLLRDYARIEAARMVAAGKDPATINIKEIENMCSRSWLDCSVPAGNA